MVVAIAIQVATNYVNDYADGVRGTDDNRVGPARLVGGGLATAASVKRAALVAGLGAGGAPGGVGGGGGARRSGAAGGRRTRAARRRRGVAGRRLLLHRRPRAVRLPRPRRAVRVRV